MKHGFQRLALLLLITVIAVGAFFIGTSTLSTRASQTRSFNVGFSGNTIAYSPAAQVATAVPFTESERIYSDIYNRVADSVVSINVVARTEGSGNFNQPIPEEEFSEGTGTGFVIDTAGHIVTNNHVVDGATRIEVNFFDGRIVRGEIVGVDPDSDLAVIQVTDIPAQELIPVTFADSDALFIGEEVVAIGSPFNQPWTLTTGIVSALNRTIRGLSNFSIGSVIQTDAAINPGNSGGPLLNLQGQVIGVNSQIISQTRSSAGIGFAIPSNLVQRVAAELIEDGSVDYSYIGIVGGDVNLYYLEALNLPNDVRGVVVTDIQPGSPAQAAGLRPADDAQLFDGVPVPTSVDIITAIDGVPVSGMASLVGYLSANTSPGQTVILTVIRDGREQVNLSATLVSRDLGR